MAVINSIIDGKYEILKKIGQGGMSKVYLAMDQRLNKQWAVKEIEKNSKDKNNEIVIQSLMAEANLMKKLDHPSLPRIVDIIDNGKTIYVVMDYIEGDPLNKILDDYGAQPQEVVIDWAKQLCEALEYLHTRKPSIIYRDMKPANVMLRPDGNIKLIDFGIAREFKEQSLADTVSLGTKGYAAPEQFGGKGQTDQRTDVYCLGVTLYHLVTGQNPCEPPYELYPIRQWNPALSGGLERIIQKCTQLNPDDRYQSCAELLYALNHYEEVDDIYRINQKKKLRAFIITAGICVIMALVGVFGQVMKTVTINTNYDTIIAQADKSQPAEAIKLYLEAVDIKPTTMNGYTGLIEAFKSDAAFTTEEEKNLKEKINAHIDDLRATPGYVDLAFEIGKLYWYYYDYGKSETNDDNQVTRIKSSTQWFEDVIANSNNNYANYNMAKIYSDIGKFNRDITLKIEEASDKNTYKPYWDNIKSLNQIIDDNTQEVELVKLEVYRLTVYSIETYARKFKADGVTESDIRNVYQSTRQKINDIETNSDKTDAIKTYLAERLNLSNDVGKVDEVKTAIDNAFRSGQEG